MTATNLGAKFKYNLAGRTSGILRSYIIGDTKTLTVGDFVHLEGGYVDPVAAAENIFGVCVGITDKDGIDMDNSKVTKEGTWTSSTLTEVTDSDNTTSEQVRALVDIDPFSVWSVEPDSTIGQDAESDMAGSYTDLLNESEVDESDAVTTVQQLFIWGVDPEDSTRGLYSIAQHQIWGQ